MSDKSTFKFVSPQLEAAKRNRLILGLFLPLQSGAWSPSTAPRGTSWTFDYNAKCTQMAEAYGFDLVFAWLSGWAKAAMAVRCDIARSRPIRS